MSHSLNIAVLQGGDSTEAAVSRNSAAQVAAALTRGGHATTLIELDSECIQQLLALAPDVVFPALHGPPGEDGTVQGLLEMMGLAYVGSDVRGSAFAMDKAIAKRAFKDAGLPVADHIEISAAVVEDASDHATLVMRLRSAFPSGMVIKPLNQGSALGVHRIKSSAVSELEALLATLHPDRYLVEPFVEGREITVGVLEKGRELIPHPVIEIVTAADEWYDYENRYTQGQSEHLIPARLAEPVRQELQRIAVDAHRVLGLRDLSRADFIVTPEDEIVLLEVNTLPGMTPTSLYPDGARALGYSFEALLDLLVRQAFARRQDS